VGGSEGSISSGAVGKQQEAANAIVSTAKTLLAAFARQRTDTPLCLSALRPAIASQMAILQRTHSYDE